VEDLQPPGHADEPVHLAPADVSEEPDAAQTAAESAEAARRRRPSTVGGAIYLAVLAAAAVGLGIVSQGNWRLGVKWIAASLVVAAAVRLALPAREAGMLAVRRRLVDVTLLTAVGLFLWFLSTNIPNQPVP
jgi:cation transport ATPase